SQARYGETKASLDLTLGAALALLPPLRIGPLQQILCAGTAQVRAAILHYHLTIDITGLVGDQEARQVCKLAMLAGAAERIALRPTFIASLGTELPRSAGSRKCAGGDRDCAHTLWPPLHRKAPGHREHGGFCHRRRHREGAAGD